MNFRAACCFIAVLWVPLLYSANPDYKEYIEKYPHANAVTLSHKISVRYYFNKQDKSLQVKSTHEIKLLALKNGADELELIQVPFSSFENLKLLSARYYIIDSVGELYLQEKVKVRFAEEKDYYINNIFYNDLKVKQFAPTVDIIPGSILRYSYEVSYNDLKFLNRISPQLTNDFVEQFELKLNFPINVEVDVIDFNFDKVGFELRESSTKENNTRTYLAKDLKPARSFNYSPPNSYVRPHFVIVTKGWTEKKNFHPVLNTTDDLYAWYSSLIIQLGPQDNYVEELSATICKNAETDEEKIEAIYTWIQENINYVAFEDGIAGFKPEEAPNVAKQKYGDCKGISNLLVSLLNESGFDAHYAWIGTRHLPYDYSLPSIVVDNHMICALKDNGNWIFLDGTDKTANWKIPPYYIQGKSVMIGLGEQYIIDTIPIQETAKNKVELELKIDLAKGRYSEASGTMKFYGYELDNIKAWSRGMERNEFEKLPIYMSENFLDYFICSEPDQKSAEYLSKPLIFSGLVTGNYFKNGNNIVLFCDISDDLKMKISDTISVARFFDNKGIKTFSFEYTLPENATINELPEDLSFTSSKGSFKCNMKYELWGTTLKYTKYVEINTLFLESSDLKEWREFVYVQNKLKAIHVEITL